ncbi:sensor histidine kinase [Paenibacillus caui]|uniref:sensor histidine kinase n=1 Tax=Paenibacillus caui TaxID=2873927 RepID=UPI003B588009
MRTDAGNLQQRVPERLGQEEIDRLSSSFNGMLERLALSFEAEREAKEQMRRFTADASHELRTPLTSIHGFLEVLLRGASVKPEQLQSALSSMYGESVRMKKLIEDLLTLAKMDRAPELYLSRIRLDALVLEMEPQLRMLSGPRSVAFDLTAGITGEFDQDKLKQVILNLFQNAVQHTNPVHGRIRVSLTSTEDEILLAVNDNGPGIPEEHLPHIFERFYRIDVARARKQGGAGLGLAISASMVEAHGGKITVATKAGEGTTFQVHLPLQQS